MWKIPILVLMCFSCAQAQRQAVLDASSSDVLPEKASEEAESVPYDMNKENEDDLWAEDGQDNYDWYSWDMDRDEDVPMDTKDSMDTVKEIDSATPAQEDTRNTEQIVPDDKTDSVATGHQGTDVEPVNNIIDELDDWDDTSLTDGELYGYQAGDYGSDGGEQEEHYPADLGEDLDLQNWPDADGDDYIIDHGDSESSEEVMSKPTPTPQLEEYGANMVVEGRKRGVFTVWHYAIFAVAGAIFILGTVIIVGAAIKAVRRPNSSYRRLADPAKV